MIATSAASESVERVIPAPPSGNKNLAFGDIAVVVAVVALTVLIVVGSHNPVRLLLSVGFALFAPGWAILRAWKELDAHSRFALSIAVSLSACIALPTVGLFFNEWYPLEFYYLLAVGSLGPPLVAIVGVLRVRGRRDSSDIATGRRLWRRVSPWTAGVIEAAARSWPLALAISLWAVSMRLTSVREANGPLGLIAALPLAYYGSLVVLLVLVAIEISRPRQSSALLWASLVSLVVMVQGPMVVLYPGPRYFWDFKAVGEASFVNAHGGLDFSLDLYQRWPGFAALTALFDHMAGIASAVGLLKWAPITFDLLFLVGVYYALRALPLTQREVWLTMFLTYGADWATNSQDILTPQAVGLPILFTIYGVIFRWFRGDESTAPPRHGFKGSIRFRVWRTGQVGWIRSRWRVTPKWAPAVLLVSVYVVLVATHPLTPFVAVLSIGSIAAVNRERPRWVVVILGALALAYLLPNYTYLVANHAIVGGVGNIASNAAPPAAAATAKLGPNHDVLIMLTGLVYGLGALGAFKRYRAKREVRVLGILTAAPLLLVGLVHYGSETSYRSILFSAPWAACLASSAFSDLAGEGVLQGGKRAIRKYWIVVAPVLVVVIGLFVISNDSQNEIYEVAPTDIEAAQWLYSTQPPGILITINGFFPLRLGGRYNEFLGVSKGDDSLGYLAYYEAPPSLITQFACSVEFGNERRVYVALTVAQQVEAIDSGATNREFLSGLRSELLNAPGWVLAYKNKTATILAYDGGC